jgi:hypothetical protein
MHFATDANALTLRPLSGIPDAERFSARSESVANGPKADFASDVW